MIHLLEGSEIDESVHWGDRYRTHRVHRAFSRFSIFLRPAMVAGFLLCIFLVVSLPWSTGRSSINPFLAPMMVVAGAAYLLLFSVSNPSYYRFFRLIEKAKVAAAKDDDFASREIGIVECVSNSGKASQNLFRFLQGRKSTWGSPPAVADRALTLSHPLIDVRIDYYSDPRAVRESLDRFVEFLERSAVLVALQRADLIPKLREKFNDDRLPRRLVSDSGRIDERDVRFLNPFHDYDRGSIVRDYLYPLGTWMSFLVALVALVVSLLK